MNYLNCYTAVMYFAVMKIFAELFSNTYNSQALAVCNEVNFGFNQPNTKKM